MSTQVKDETISKTNQRTIKLYDNTDQYWQMLWTKIDNSEKSIFFLTYCMDNQFIANYTITKLIKALERGVPVVLMIEHLNYYPKRKLLSEFEMKGGIVIKPNNAEKIVNHIRKGRIKKFFNRYHQKIYLIDKDLFIGSSNLANEYSGTEFGSGDFLDLNMFIENTPTYSRLLNLFDRYIKENNDQINRFNEENYKKLKEKVLVDVTNKDYKDIINEAHETYKKGMKGLIDNSIEEMFHEEAPPEFSEIQDTIYKMIKEAEKQILIIQPYYLRIKKVDQMLVDAKKRGVDVKIITSYNRDQPAYRHLYNSELFEHLQKEDILVLEYMYKYLHMKAYYIDNKYLSIGSMNQDITSFIMNNEGNYFMVRTENTEEAFQSFESIVERVSKDSRKVINVRQFNLFRWISNRWWHFFIWSMEKTVPNRKLDK